MFTLTFTIYTSSHLVLSQTIIYRRQRYLGMFTEQEYRKYRNRIFGCALCADVRCVKFFLQYQRYYILHSIVRYYTSIMFYLICRGSGAVGPLLVLMIYYILYIAIKYRMASLFQSLLYASMLWFCTNQNVTLLIKNVFYRSVVCVVRLFLLLLVY